MSSEVTTKEVVTEVVTKEKNITDYVLTRIGELKEMGAIKIPADYSPENALKSAWFVLQGVKDKNDKPALEVCGKYNIANCLLDMVVQGLSPLKKQCYFIVYGEKLTLLRSYMGTVAVCKRVANLSSALANVIYEKDEFEFEINPETGNRRITKHKQTLESLDGNITGAYAILTFNDGSKYVDIMSIEQIKASWQQGAAKGDSPAHKNFAGEMAKKTIINRACKLFINTSSDAELMDDDDFEMTDRLDRQIRHEIIDNANKGEVIDMGKVEEEAPKQKPEISELGLSPEKYTSHETGTTLTQQALDDYDTPGF